MSQGTGLVGYSSHDLKETSEAATETEQENKLDATSRSFCSSYSCEVANHVEQFMLDVCSWHAC